MKYVLQVVGKMNIGGAEQLLMNVYRNINRSKIQFDFLTFYDEGEYGFFDAEIQSLGGKIINIRKPSAIHPLRNIEDVRKVLRLKNYDAVHTHIGSNCAYALCAARAEGVKIRIAHSHNTPAVNRSQIGKLYDAGLRTLSNSNLTKCAACSKDAAQWRFSKKHIEKDYIYVPNSLDFSKYLREYNTEEIRREINATGKTMILQVGNVKEQKNQLFSIKLANAYVQNHENVLFVFAGRVEGSYSVRVQNAIEQYGIHNNVVFLGQRTDIPQLMAAADVMIMPSLWEGLGIVLIEAQASGLPCVVSETIQDEADIGVELVSKCKLDDMASWISALDNSKKIVRASIQERERFLEESGFNLKRTVQCFEELYEI